MPAQQLAQGLFAQRLGRLRPNGGDDGLRELCELVFVLDGRQGDGVKEFDALRCDERGQTGNASGVPPAGDWMSDGRDYRDAKFSTYWEGALKVGTISMGLAVRIPHTKDDGAFCLRVVLDFLVEGHTFSVQIGDGKIIGGLPIDGAPSDLLPVYDEVFAYVKDIFVHPVNYFEAQRAGKIGFLPA
jgi:hypothetical protein